jgi:hypothetical protein
MKQGMLTSIPPVSPHLTCLSSLIKSTYSFYCTWRLKRPFGLKNEFLIEVETAQLEQVYSTIMYGARFFYTCLQRFHNVCMCTVQLRALGSRQNLNHRQHAVQWPYRKRGKGSKWRKVAGNHIN